jgi:purine nucleosidase
LTDWHIDTDMGVDDALALAVSHTLPDVRITGVSTVFGNVSRDQASRNAGLLLRLLYGDAPPLLIAGADRARDGSTRDATSVHGVDGLGGATAALPPGLLQGPTPPGLDRLSPAPRQVTLLAIGPATNLPDLVRRLGHVERIVIMAGAFFDTGNMTADAEFNALCDPEALAETLALGVPTLLVPLDVCRKVQLARATAQAWRSAAPSPAADLLATSHMHYMDHYASWEGIDGCFPHDTIAALVARWPHAFFRLRGQVTVEMAGVGRGRTRLMEDPSSPVEVVTGGSLKWVRDGLPTLAFTPPGS